MSETGRDKTGGRKMRFKLTSSNTDPISTERPPGGAAVQDYGIQQQPCWLGNHTKQIY